MLRRAKPREVRVRSALGNAGPIRSVVADAVGSCLAADIGGLAQLLKGMGPAESVDHHVCIRLLPTAAVAWPLHATGRIRSPAARDAFQMPAEPCVLAGSSATASCSRAESDTALEGRFDAPESAKLNGSELVELRSHA